jgi:cold shock CspA family protein
MRFQGRITDWQDDRGFGFIVPNGGGPKVFLHFRAMQRGEGRPAGGELVTFESVEVPGKGPRAEKVAYVERNGKGKRAVRNPDETPATRGGGWLSVAIAVAVVAALAVLGWQKYREQRRADRVTPAFESPGVPPSAAPRPAPLAEQIAPGSSAYRCDGRTMCSQMTSCDEAKYFLKNCPGVRMDGNGDGIPCERQWCK